ncbi:DUF805 domain-containing protein [Novosphingobium sp. KCTC 2891]|uniref:DUF805 domain-containing protein n=1 Tax=Novosphingobium sp. KCTC 2891 TaxID=2989730 RepID=UPI0022238CDE|nr:DUF805 domain-containing protein [Novosphingobium sp. KCTC 2891]MCW1381535.1 DUF805 domain-containing protein [Novosphingobium sp. KCTC 2891]
MNWMLLPYRRYAEFSGRSRRREYWMFVLFYLLVFVVLNAVFGTNEVTRTPTGFGYGSRLVGGGGLLGGLFALASLLPALAVSVRRLHDQDRTGWLVLLALIPFLGGFALLVLMCLEGTRGPNRFGPDPKNPAGAEIFS